MVCSMIPGFMMVAQFCMTHAFFGYPTALGTPGLSRASSTGGERVEHDFWTVSH